VGALVGSWLCAKMISKECRVALPFCLKTLHVLMVPLESREGKKGAFSCTFLTVLGRIIRYEN
jgi:hypothetical protein